MKTPAAQVLRVLLLAFPIVPNARAQPPTPVVVTVLEQQLAHTVERSYAGAVEARQESRLGFELGGLVAEVLVDEGDRVDAGSPLARLDTARLAARLAEARAAEAQARAELQLAETTFARTEAALAIDGVSRQELDEARHRRDALAAARARARARSEALEVDLSKAILSAPYAGAVLARHVDAGDVVTPGLPVVELREDGALEARVGVAARDLGTVGAGEVITIEHAGSRTSAVVRAVLDRRALRARTVDVILRLPPGLAARPGDLVRVLLPVREEVAGFRVPATALAEGARGLWTVYALVEGEGGFAVERRSVDVLALDDGAAYVQGSIAPRERIVAAGVHRLVPGQRVRPAGGDARGAP